jgi:molybdopterin-containing oxidoreductase family iron-sulfur binding subunit
MSADANDDLSRRGFLAISAATLGGVVLAPGIRLIEIAGARAPEQAVSKQVRWGLLIDTNKCTPGCDDCVKACATENGLKNTGHPRTDAQWIRKVELKDIRTGHTNSVPVMCQHCEEPPCVDVCPTGASFKRADGIVLVDRHICIGCRYCMMACPYKARSIVFQSITDQNPDVPRGNGCAEACTLCVHRVDQGQQPACVDACTRAGHNAMVFGDLNDPQSDIAQRVAKYASTQIRADFKLNPGVRYQGL